MSRILNVASMAAVLLTATGMVALTEPGFANDVAAEAQTPVVLVKSIAGETAPEPVAPSAATTVVPVKLVEPIGPEAITKTPEVVTKASVRAGSLAELVAMTPKPADLDDELRCLAGAVYFESRSETLTGQLAVAHVVINRANSGRFARTLCGVVFQKSQFSFVRGGSMPAINTSGKQWANAVAIAQIARNDGWKNQAPGALYFHARYVSPGWNRPRVAQIDNHIFYR